MTRRIATLRQARQYIEHHAERIWPRLQELKAAEADIWGADVLSTTPPGAADLEVPLSRRADKEERVAQHLKRSQTLGKLRLMMGRKQKRLARMHGVFVRREMPGLAGLLPSTELVRLAERVLRRG